MLTETQLSQLLQDLVLSEEALATIKVIRSSERSRHMKSVRRSVSGCYPSRNMRSSIQLESRRCELPYLYQIEHDNKDLEFYDQPSY
jgi:putative transposase